MLTSLFKFIMLYFYRMELFLFLTSSFPIFIIGEGLGVLREAGLKDTILKTWLGSFGSFLNFGAIILLLINCHDFKNGLEYVLFHLTYPFWAGRPEV